MINNTMEQALNSQINEEMLSSYLYLAMAAYFNSIDLPGFATWMKVQAKEENGHAMKIFDFVHERSGRVQLTQIAQPPRDWPSALAAFEAALAHERHISAKIAELVDLARAEGDKASEAFLQWFVTEQVEEEAHAEAIVKKLRMVGDSPQGLLMLDHALGQRSS